MMPIEAIRGQAISCAGEISEADSEGSDPPAFAESTPMELVREYENTRKNIQVVVSRTTVHEVHEKASDKVSVTRRPDESSSDVPPPPRHEASATLSPRRSDEESSRDLSTRRRRDTGSLESTRCSRLPENHNTRPTSPKKERSASPGLDRMNAPSSVVSEPSVGNIPSIVKEEDTKEVGAPEDSAHSAQDTGVIYRGKRGEKITRAEWLELEEKKKKKKKKNRRNDPPPVLEWGGGLLQKVDKAAQILEDKRIAAEPLARYEIDASLDEQLRQRARWEDPFFGGIPQEDAVSTTRTNDKAAAALSGSGTAQSVARPKCRFPCPENRFGIKPGYRWDGVIRGNKFEERLAAEKNRRRHEETESYKWSVADI